MATFDVPKKDQVTLGELATLPPQQIAGIFRALEEAEPALLLHDLAGRVAEAAELDQDVAYKVVRVLSTMYAVRTRSGLSVEDFIGHVLASIKGSEDVAFDEARETDFRGHLRGLLSIESLFVTAKALDVFQEHDHVLCRPRVMTDMRPIFGLDDTPRAAVAVHTLRIRYHSGAKSGTDDFYVALDSEDIRDLRDKLDRALKKEQEIAKIAIAQGLQWLEPTSGGGGSEE